MLWPDIENTWSVELINLNGETNTRHWNITDGVQAILSAQRLHNNPRRPGNVYVITPRGAAYLVQDNGLTRVGF